MVISLGILRIQILYLCPAKCILWSAWASKLKVENCPMACVKYCKHPDGGLRFEEHSTNVALICHLRRALPEKLNSTSIKESSDGSIST